MNFSPRTEIFRNSRHFQLCRLCAYKSTHAQLSLAQKTHNTTLFTFRSKQISFFFGVGFRCANERSCLNFQAHESLFRS